MIIAKNRNAADYRGIDPNLDKALACLTDEFLSSVGSETAVIDGKNIYANLNLFETVPVVDGFFESHRDYMDIHVLLEGEERMDMADTAKLTLDEAACKPENDFYAYSDKEPEFQPVIMKPGMFLVAFPTDAHRVKVQLNGPSQVRKIVFKVKITE